MSKPLIVPDVDLDRIPRAMIERIAKAALLWLERDRSPPSRESEPLVTAVAELERELSARGVRR